MALCNPGNQHIPLIAGIAQEAAPVTYRLMAEDVGSALSTTSSPTVRMRKSSVVDAGIEPTCSDLAQGAQAGLLTLGWVRHGRWWHALAASGARGATAAIAFQPFVT